MGDGFPARLVVENIRQNWATILYAGGDHPAGLHKAGWARVRARAFPGGKLVWGHPGKFTPRVSEDRTALVVTREQGGRSASILMARVMPGSLGTQLPLSVDEGD